MTDISDLLDCKPAWECCPRCNKWLPSHEALVHHWELVHQKYTAFDG